MAGISVPPTAAAVADEEPDIVANIIDVTIDAFANPPRIHPVSETASSTRREAIPPACINRPARMKNGIAINENESSDSKTICGTMTSEVPRS